MLKLEVIKENKDGTADVVFDYDDTFISYYKKETGRETIDDKEVGQFIVKMLSEGIAPTPKEPSL